MTTGRINQVAYFNSCTVFSFLVKSVQFPLYRQLKINFRFVLAPTEPETLIFHSFFTQAQLNELCSLLLSYFSFYRGKSSKMPAARFTNLLMTELAPTEQVPFPVDASILTANYSFSSNHFTNFTFL